MASVKKMQAVNRQLFCCSPVFPPHLSTDFGKALLSQGFPNKNTGLVHDKHVSSSVSMKHRNGMFGLAKEQSSLFITDFRLCVKGRHWVCPFLGSFVGKKSRLRVCACLCVGGWKFIVWHYILYKWRGIFLSSLSLALRMNTIGKWHFLICFTIVADIYIYMHSRSSH